MSPRLRVPEFREGKGWARVPLTSVLSEDKIKSDGKAEVHSVSLTKGVVSQVEHMGRSFSAADTSHYSLVKPFDVVYTKSPLAIFKLGIVKQHRGPHNALVSPLYGVFTPANRHIGQLIEAYFDSPSRSLRFLDPLAQKGAKNTIQISNERFLSGELFLPSDEREQQKIADCLGSLDDLIAAEGRKLEALRQHKQGLMQRLFPHPGKTQPLLRFTEFRDAPDWEQAALGTLLDRPPEYGVNAPAVPFSEDLPAYIRITDIDDDGRFVPAPRVSVDIEPSDDQFLQLGDIVLARTGASVGKSHRYRVEDGRLVFAGFLIRVRPNPQRLLSEFLAAYLSAWRYWEWVRLTSARSGQPGINGAEYASMPLPLPPNGRDLAEQQKIADCLNSLDDLIAAVGRKIDALRQNKRGLMQQLFPSLEGH